MTNLKEFQVVELDSVDLIEFNGGFLPALLAGIALVGAGIYIYNNAGDFVKGFKEGYN